MGRTSAAAGRVMGWPNTLSPHDCGPAIEGVWPSLFFGGERVGEMRRKLARLDWARAAAAQWGAEAEGVLAKPPHLPEGIIGWRHDFYSPATAEHLLFDPHDAERLVDPWDGTVYGPDGTSSLAPEHARGRAWRLLAHERTYRLMHTLGVLYALTGDERYAAWVAEGTRRARVMFRRDDLRAANRHRALYLQPLYDAQVLLLLATAYDLTRSSAAYTPADHDGVRREIFEPAMPYQMAFLDSRAPQNMMAYVAAALATAGDVFGRTEWRTPAYDHPRSGFYALLDYALRRDAHGGTDGFWVEGTQFYHLYSVCPLIALLERAAGTGAGSGAGTSANGPNIGDARRRVRALLEAPARMADEALRLPAFGDLGAPRHLNLRLYRHLYEYAAGRLDGAEFGPLLARVYGDRAPRASLAAVAYGPDQLDRLEQWDQPTDPAGPPDRSGRAGRADSPGRSLGAWRSERFSAMGIAFLRATDRRTGARYQVWLRAGAHGEGHDHPDKLSFGLHTAGEVLATDLGTAGYGNAAFTAYCRSTFSHNTLLVDERSQERVSRARLDTGTSWASGVVDDAYPGVRLARRIRLDPPYVWLEDLCESDAPHRYAWALHVYGSLSVTAPPETPHDARLRAGSGDGGALPPLPDDGPFAWFTNRRGGVIDRVSGVICADWCVRDGLWLRVWAASDGQMEWTAGQTAGNPIPDRRRTLLLRAAGARRRFRAALEVHHGAPALGAAPEALFGDIPLGRNDGT